MPAKIFHYACGEKHEYGQCPNDLAKAIAVERAIRIEHRQANKKEIVTYEQILKLVDKKPSSQHKLSVKRSNAYEPNFTSKTANPTAKQWNPSNYGHSKINKKKNNALSENLGTLLLISFYVVMAIALIYPFLFGRSNAFSDNSNNVYNEYVESDTPSAICNDGTYSFSITNRGTCSGHGGVSAWL